MARARWLAPFSSSLRTAESKLSAYRDDVRSARSPEEVAARFGALVRLASSDSTAVSVSGSCHYSTGEIIAIVFGFILAIIPGIILLFVLC